MNTPSSETAVRTNILGATGLSRAVLADLFRRRGLFGRDSQLGLAEQAVVQSRLPAIPGIARLPVTATTSPRLAALAVYVEALVAGHDAEPARRQLLAAGLPVAAVQEAAVTVDNVRVLFGTARVQRSAPVAPAPVTVVELPLARAA